MPLDEYADAAAELDAPPEDDEIVEPADDDEGCEGCS